MRRIAWLAGACASLVLAVCFATYAAPDRGTGQPIKFISSCEIDLDGNEQPDLTLLLETRRGRELIVLMARQKGYEAIMPTTSLSNMYLSCEFGSSITETEAGPNDRKPRTFKTPGAYVRLFHPEGASVAYFWEKDKFREVWTND